MSIATSDEVVVKNEPICDCQSISEATLRLNNEQYIKPTDRHK